MNFMKEIKLDKKNPETIESAAETAREILSAGGVIIFPTDTIYGLGANAFDENAILKIYKIKKRSREKPISVLVRDMEMARKIVCIDSRAETIISRFWPGPVTFILRKKDVVSYVLTADTENVAVRIADDIFIKKLFEKVDFPITATSANLAGEKNLLSVKEMELTFTDKKNLPDLIIDAGEPENSFPSAIIDLTDIKSPKLVRAGTVSAAQLENILGKLN